MSLQTTNMCRSMSSFFLTPMLIISLSLLSNVLAQDYSRYRNCSSSFQCGNLTNIGYPFYGGDRPSYCGYPGFQLTNCTTQAPVIYMSGLTYQVLDIFYDRNVVQVVRTDYVENLCPASFHSTILNHTLFDSLSDSASMEIFYGCSQATNVNFTGQFSCKTDGIGTTNRYLTPSMARTATFTGVRSLLKECSHTVFVPAYEWNIASLDNNLTQEKLVSTINRGFGLSWKAENSLCETCKTTGGQCGYNNTNAAFTCLSYNRPEQLVPASLNVLPRTGKESQRRLAIGLSIAGAPMVIGIGLCCFYLSVSRGKTVGTGRKIKNHKQIEAIIRDYGSLTPKRYSFSEIKKMTNSFREKLGEGGFGCVYKGKLQNGDVVAVKISRECKGDGTDFTNEVASFSRTSHVNVIRLQGYCYEETRRALIYEYMSNGSLDKFISEQRSLPSENHLKWEKLYEIAVGIARGLEYLHRGCVTRIVHFDIKPHNILLDEDLSPKISDFGLAKLSKTRESRVSMLDARGTIGYIAPEVIYRRFGEVSYRADVFSFGMMVLEIIGARKHINVGASETYFPDWIYDHIENVGVSRLHEIFAGENAEDVEDEERIKKMVIVGLWCIQMNPLDRPSMTKVVEMLEGSLESLQVPPQHVVYPSATKLPSTFSSTASQFTTVISSQLEENS